MILSEEQEHILVHTLTGSTLERKVYRNYYACGANQLPELDTLVAAGLMVAGRQYHTNGERYYHCTEAGAEIVGLHLPKDD